jgi:soluble lytic murein transglycosylase
MALAYERGFNSSSSDDEPGRQAGLWRQAALLDRLGQFHHSHNIARLRIDRRPWVQPARGRLARWSIAYPDAYQTLISRAVLTETAQHDEAEVLPSLASALMREESAFLADVESWAGALGLMQLMPATARGHARLIPGDVTRDKLLSPWPNIRIGVGHLFMLADDFSNHPVKMIAAYNAGGGAVNSWASDHTDIALWVEDIPYRQTRHYVKRVMGSYAAYQWLNGRRLDPRIALQP